MSQATESITATPPESTSLEELERTGRAPLKPREEWTWQPASKETVLTYESELARNERRRKLEALSSPWWVEVVAEMNRHAKRKLFHTPVNRERTGFQGWGNR